MGTPADIGNAVALLCSPDAGWITGQLIYFDGGASLADTLLPLEIQHWLGVKSRPEFCEGQSFKDTKSAKVDSAPVCFEPPPVRSQDFFDV